MIFILSYVHGPPETLMRRHDLNPSAARIHEAINAELTEANSAGTLQGWRSQVDLPSGIMFSCGCIRTLTEIDTKAHYQPGRWLSIYLRGAAKTAIEGGDSLKACAQQWQLIASPTDFSTRTRIAENTEFSGLQIGIPNQWVARLCENHDDSAAHFFATDADRPTLRSGKLPASLVAVIEDLVKPVGENALEHLRLEARVLDTLISLATAVSVEEAEERPLASDKAQALEQARAILLTELHHPPTIPDLARRVGLSATVLKDGFRLQFDQTIGEFLLEKRFERVVQSLPTARNVAEVAYAVGWSPSYLSSAFRRRFGYSPRTLLRQTSAR